MGRLTQLRKAHSSPEWTSARPSVGASSVVSTRTNVFPGISVREVAHAIGTAMSIQRTVTAKPMTTELRKAARKELGEGDG